MFSSFQHTTEVSFQSPSTFYHQPHRHNRLAATTTTTATTATSSSTAAGVPTAPSAHKQVPASQRKPGRKRSYNSLQHQDDHGHEDDEKKKKKMEHREIERKRRQEMANLCSSLRSLLPVDFIKGRRSMSEHMNQTVNYIKHLEENIKGLSTRRDELKKTCHVTDSSVLLKKNVESDQSPRDSIRHPISVTVGCSHGGIEILITSCTKQEGFPISRVLKALVQEGLNVISCNSTIVNERLIQSIQSEVSTEEECNIDQVSKLQQKLAELVNTGS